MSGRFPVTQEVEAARTRVFRHYVLETKEAFFNPIMKSWDPKQCQRRFLQEDHRMYVACAPLLKGAVLFKHLWGDHLVKPISSKMKEALKKHVVVVNASGSECLLQWVGGSLAPQVAPLEEHFPLEVKVREADWETFVVHVRLA